MKKRLMKLGAIIFIPLPILLFVPSYQVQMLKDWLENDVLFFGSGAAMLAISTAFWIRFANEPPESRTTPAEDHRR